MSCRLLIRENGRYSAECNATQFERQSFYVYHPIAVLKKLTPRRRARSIETNPTTSQNQSGQCTHMDSPVVQRRHLHSVVINSPRAGSGQKFTCARPSTPPAYNQRPNCREIRQLNARLSVCQALWQCLPVIWALFPLPWHHILLWNNQRITACVDISSTA